MPPNFDSAQNIVTDAAVSNVATRWGMGGGLASTTVGWLTHSTTVIMIGLIVTVGGFIINYIYQRRRDRREVEEVAFRRKLELDEEYRRIELHQAQLTAIKHTIREAP